MDDLVSHIFLEKIGELRLAWVVRLLVQGEQHFAGEILSVLCCLEESALATEYRAGVQCSVHLYSAVCTNPSELRLRMRMLQGWEMK